MTALSHQLTQSYAQHPSFAFDSPPMRIDPVLLDEFDSAYDRVRSGTTPMPSAQLQSSTGECERALARVFSSLEVQSTDQFEHRFLQELQRECARVLGEEISHFASCRSSHQPAPGAVAQARTDSLRRDHHYFGALAADAVAEMLQMAEPALQRFRENAREGRLTREDLSENSGHRVRRIVRVLNREFGDTGTLEAVSAYIGRSMVVTGLAVELSVPQATWWANGFAALDRPPRTLYAHLDESLSVPKAIVYLSDVDATTGPTSCYPQAYRDLALRPLQELVGRVVGNVGNGADSPLREHYRKQYHQSMTSEAFRRHFMRLPPSMRFSSHFGWDVLPGSAAEAALVERERVMTGVAGTFIVFDGAKLLHRGGMVQQQERIALQVVFSEPRTWRRRIVGRIKRALA